MKKVIKQIQDGATVTGKITFLKAYIQLCPLFALLVAIGCNSSKFDFAQVSGQVMMDGKPVPNARVTFIPSSTSEDGEAGPYSNGETDETGRYELKSVEASPNKGAVIGKHRVIVSTKKAHRDPNDLDIEVIDVKEIIPHPYNHYRKTPLTFEVTSDGSDSANFELVSR